jgi:hypothetical protein
MLIPIAIPIATIEVEKQAGIHAFTAHLNAIILNPIAAMILHSYSKYC